MIRQKHIFWLGILLLGPLLTPLVSAHTVSLTYAEVRVDERQVRWFLKLPVPELDVLLGLDANHDGAVDAAELVKSHDAIQRYVLSKLSVIDGGQETTGTLGEFRLWKDREGHPFVETDATFAPQGRAFGRVVLRCDVLQDVVASHRTVAKIASGGRTQDFEFGAGGSYSADARPSRLQNVWQFVRMGVWHIFTGYDHIAFLLGVVLIGGSFKAILKVVTSFTVAHSITLALAAFGIVTLPSWLVESGIALSIMYIAVENLFFKTFDRRWMITFFFGLVHGFGFASALQEVHLPRQLLATALFSFNLGVEAGQLCIVAALLPGLLYLSRLRINTLVVKGCSAMIFAMGAFWLWQRLAEGS